MSPFSPQLRGRVLSWFEHRRKRREAERKEAERLRIIREHHEAVVQEIRRDDIRLTKITHAGEVRYGVQYRERPGWGWKSDGLRFRTRDDADLDAWRLARTLAKARELAVVEVLQ